MTRPPSDIPGYHPDCRHYTGYKPCPKGGDDCEECAPEDLRGAEILIIKIGAMGDVLRTKCLLPGLKRRWPQSTITWLTAPGSIPLVRDRRVDQILPLTHEGTLALSGRRFDVLLCLDKEAPALALARQIDADLKLGYAPTPHNTLSVWNEGAEYALRMGLSDDFKFRRNRLTHQAILYRMAEMDYHGEDYDLSIPAPAVSDADGLFARLGIPAGRPVIGLNTGCGPVFQTKAWTEEGMAELAARLTVGGEASLLLLGGPLEAGLHARLADRLGGRMGCSVFDAGTDNPLETFFALVDRCDVLVSSDSLAMHVGIALKKRVVAFFGPTCEQEVDLFGLGEKIVTDYECSPCYLKTCDVRPSCMQALTAETVEAAVRRQLAAKAPA